MSNEKLIDCLHNFFQTIYDYPNATIEKKILIQMIDKLILQNPELENVYSTLTTAAAASAQTPESIVYADLDIPNNNISPRRESDSVRNNPTKEGELTVKKDSTLLWPVLKKKYLLKTDVYGELIVKKHENENLIYFNVYDVKKSRQLLHSFLLDKTCSFASNGKKEFSFRYSSGIEIFTVAGSDTADSWVKSFKDIMAKYGEKENFKKIPVIDDQPRPIVEETYVFPSEDTFNEPLHDIPSRPPPRPPRSGLHTDSFPPENIYVCLYDHFVTTPNSDELEFSCGDILLIVNTNGPNFYVGHKPNQQTMGLVYKEYIRRAYQTVS